MEDNVRADLKKCPHVLQENLPTEEVVNHQHKYEHINKVEAKNVSKADYAAKTVPPLEINSKSDSWFVIGSHHQQSNMIIPAKDSQRLYFHCGDMEVVPKYSRRLLCLSDEELMKRLKPCQDYENKVKELIKYIENNIEIADLKINIYMSACDKHCLSPYPSYIIEESVIGMESLALINDHIPPVSVLKHYLVNNNVSEPNEHVVNVLHWLLVTFSEPIFNNCDSKSFERILNKVEFLVNVKYPSRIFVFKYRKLNEAYWEAEKGELESKYAFLPITMEHAHSVAHLGVHPHIFTEGIHGLGLYLTTDLAYCINSSPAQWVWGKSMLGIECQIVLQVEFIYHPSVITFLKNKAILEDETLPVDNITSGRWYFIPSHRLVRVRYLLLFVKTPAKTILPKPSKPSKSLSDLYMHKPSILILTVTLTMLIFLKRQRFTSVLYSVFASFSTYFGISSD